MNVDRVDGALGTIADEPGQPSEAIRSTRVYTVVRSSTHY